MKSKQREDLLYGGLGDLGEAAVVGVQWWVMSGGDGLMRGDVVLMLELPLTLTMMLMPILMLKLMMPVKLTLADAEADAGAAADAHADESERKGVEWRVCVSR